MYLFSDFWTVSIHLSDIFRLIWRHLFFIIIIIFDIILMAIYFRIEWIINLLKPSGLFTYHQF